MLNASMVSHISSTIGYSSTSMYAEQYVSLGSLPVDHSFNARLTSVEMVIAVSAGHVRPRIRSYVSDHRPQEV